LVNPGTTIGLAALDAEPATPPLLDTHEASKCSTALPPSLEGVNTAETDALPRVAIPIVGASGTPSGTTAFVRTSVESSTVAGSNVRPTATQLRGLTHDTA
jgi:hypothetical protein